MYRKLVYLRAAIGMGDEAVARFAEVDGHLEGVKDEIGAQVLSGLPAHDAPREDVFDEREVDEPFASLEIREIANPQLVGSVRAEVSLDEISRPRRRLVGLSQPAPLGLALRALEAVLAHQALNAAATDVNACVAQRLPSPP